MPLVPFTIGAVVGGFTVYLLKKNKSTKRKEK